MTSKRLPVFIISFNRGIYLRQVIDSYYRQSLPVDVIVHDNGSDDPATLDTLSRLEKEGVAVYRRSKIDAVDDLNLVDKSIRSYFGWFRKRSQYVVTDCDIDLSIASPDTLEVYRELLERFPDAECVGPMLRIEDIPESYPLYNRVMNRHIEQFWHKQPEIIETRYGQCAFIRAQIDTTFALHREGSRFRRMKKGLRVYNPFEALHLDWYPHNLESAYQKSSSSEISHWNNTEQFSEYGGEKLRFDQYNVVDADKTGIIIIRNCKVKLL